MDRGELLSIRTLVLLFLHISFYIVSRFLNHFASQEILSREVGLLLSLRETSLS